MEGLWGSTATLGVAHLKNVCSGRAPTHQMTGMPTSCKQIPLELWNLPREDVVHGPWHSVAIWALDLHQATASSTEVMGALPSVQRNELQWRMTRLPHARKKGRHQPHSLLRRVTQGYTEVSRRRSKCIWLSP